MAQKTPPTELDELNAHIPGLIARDRELLKEQLGLEKSGILPEEPSAAATRLANLTAHYLNGFNALHLVGSNRGERLYNIHLHRRAIERDLSTLEQRRQGLLALEAEHAARAAEPTYRARLRRFLLADNELRLAWEDLQATPGLHLQPAAHLVGHKPPVNWSADPHAPLRREALRMGILSRSEIDEP